METHGPVAMNAAVWFTILSPVITLAIGLLGAWLLI
jgi:hypothetical protein